MDFIQYTLKGSVILVAETIIYWIFYNGLYERKQIGWKCGVILLMMPVGFALGSYWNERGLPITFKIFFLIMIGCVITKLLFYSSWKSILVHQWIWLFCSIIGDSLSMGILSIILDEYIMSEILDNTTILMQAEILSKIINLIIVLIIIKKIGKETNRYTMSETFIFLLQGISGMTCLFFVLDFSVNNISNYKIPSIFLIIVSILILASYIVFYSVFDSYIQKRNIEQEAMKVQFYNQGQYEYYAALDQENLNVRKMYHDLKNHLIAIQGLNNESADGSNTYVQKCLEAVDGYTEFFDTGNKLADIIFYEKCNTAKNHNIKTRIMIQKDSLNDIEMLDLCAILTNSFDNAMEACKKCKGERYIQVKTIKNDAAVILTVKNNFEIDPVMNKKGDLITSKKNKLEHGLGMRSLKMAASKYNGNVEISIDKDKREFLLIIMIPIAYQNTL